LHAYSTTCGTAGVVVVARLDRLARLTRDLLEIAKQLKDAGAGLRSLAEPEFERALIHQRTSAGRTAAKNRGVRSPVRRSTANRVRSKAAKTDSLEGCPPNSCD
jgi:DNA invertase Pin-like site-specific DNA recombinase